MQIVVPLMLIAATPVGAISNTVNLFFRISNAMSECFYGSVVF